jgi:glutamate carboxypeptidase
MTDELVNAFSVLKGEVRRVPLAPFTFIDQSGYPSEHAIADALIIQKRPQAVKQVLLVCHTDTVYPADHHFQDVIDLDHNMISGPGITDAKGGIVIMLKALQALEQSSLGKNIGWKVIINTDEEIGSPSSLPLFAEYAGQCQIGFVFEPCLANGHLVGTRKGSANFIFVATGKAAHAGRNIKEGRNAIEALARCIPQVSGLNGKREHLTVNIGIIHGGTATNVVPEKASASYNIRFMKKEDFDFFENKVSKLIAAISKDTGVEITCKGRISAQPKPLEGKTLDVFMHVQKCGRELGLDIQWEDSGGVCDGNRLQSGGLPTVDTLGVQGGNIHSDKEYLIVSSLMERTKLTTLALMKWASGEWKF